jgi:ketosteroid isomerase-like protein
MAATPTDPAERIAALEDARYRAMIAGDLEGLARSLSDRLTYTHSNAHVESKAEYIASVGKGVFKYRDIKIAERQIRAAGGAVLVTGRITIDILLDGQPKMLQSRFLNVWVEEGGDWRMIAWQSTPIPAGAGH